jgi:hypothetical protein
MKMSYPENHILITVDNYDQNHHMKIIDDEEIVDY